MSCLFSGSEKRDVTRHCQNVMKILDLAKSTEQRLTALKLLETWMGKGVQTLRIKGAEAPSIAREKLERIIAHMLLEGYIEESFHFTPYSTISYLVPGEYSQVLSLAMCFEKSYLSLQSDSRNHFLQTNLQNRSPVRILVKFNI